MAGRFFIAEPPGNPWYTYIIEYYPPKKRNEASSHEITWRKLKYMKPTEKGYILLDSNDKTFLGKEKLWRQ